MNSELDNNAFQKYFGPLSEYLPNMLKDIRRLN